MPFNLFNGKVLEVKTTHKNELYEPFKNYSTREINKNTDFKEKQK